MSQVLNMPGFWIWESYTGFWTCRVTVQVNGYFIERWAYSEPCERSKIEHFGKIIIAFNYSFKTLHLDSLRELWICEYVLGLKYVRVLNIAGKSICQGSEFLWFKGMQLWKGSEYSRIPNISGSCICEGNTSFWICLNRAGLWTIPGQSLTGFWICLWFLMWQGLEYGKIVNIWGLHRVLNMPG